ncbi:hypothetical protein QBC33DRAFT_361176 [Phialemonium atrogriseum]|uniref:Uncharacterized protein n=1 Tax=Phialemonium atrogriseum TaxID=1093897 RepID=A0AAJ0FHP6_9PEZI|nr:uncharacterized protein QBC33DRAFT_361176 [Phialemonium atrogriseum]KAK1768806.1 hypothetical protein QBC33DRAFT_361176 [Phialemonium atrogriseum]
MRFDSDHGQPQSAKMRNGPTAGLEESQSEHLVTFTLGSRTTRIDSSRGRLPTATAGGRQLGGHRFGKLCSVLYTDRAIAIDQCHWLGLGADAGIPLDGWVLSLTQLGGCIFCKSSHAIRTYLSSRLHVSSRRYYSYTIRTSKAICAGFLIMPISCTGRSCWGPHLPPDCPSQLDGMRDNAIILLGQSRPTARFCWLCAFSRSTTLRRGCDGDLPLFGFLPSSQNACLPKKLQRSRAVDH